MDYMVADPKNPQQLFNGPTAKGRIIFDHEWLEEYYTTQLDHVAHGLFNLTRQLGGCSEEHEKTKLAARAAAKWRI